MAPRLDAKWVFLLALVGKGEYFLAFIIAHELSEFLYVTLSLLHGFHEGSVHDLGWGTVSCCLKNGAEF